MKPKQRKIRAWAIFPAFPSSKEVEVFPLLTKEFQFEIYLTKKSAQKKNQKMDEDIKRC